MHTFATLKHIGTFKKVCFYSIKLENSDLSLYEEFYEKFGKLDELKEEMDILFSQIKAIGNRGALSHYFRHEGSAEALPT